MEGRGQFNSRGLGLRGGGGKKCYWDNAGCMC